MTTNIEMSNKNYARFEDDPEAQIEPDNIKGSEIRKELKHLTSKLKTSITIRLFLLSAKFDAFAVPADLGIARDHLVDKFIS
jgi:hypothetical protein